MIIRQEENILKEKDKKAAEFKQRLTHLEKSIRRVTDCLFILGFAVIINAIHLLIK